MLDWWLDDQKGFNQSVDKAKGKYKGYLNKDFYQPDLKTYSIHS